MSELELSENARAIEGSGDDATSDGSSHTGTALVQASREVLAKKARSFRWGAAFLPAGQRDDAAVVYAFCRLVDDLADETPDPVTAAKELEAMRAELKGCRPARPLVALFLEVAARRGIEPAWALELIEGVRSDTGPVCMADDVALLRYCYRVAGTVGLLMCGVLGVRVREAYPYAIDLGIAMQLTNICRDVLEDSGKGRVYLPATRLRAAGCEPRALLDGQAERTAVATVTGQLLELADRYYRSADEGMRFIPWRSRAAILVAGRLYRAIGLRLRRGGCDTLAGRTVVPWYEKLFHAGRAFLAFFHPRSLGLTKTARHDPGLHRGLEGLPEVDERR